MIDTEYFSLTVIRASLQEIANAFDATSRAVRVHSQWIELDLSVADSTTEILWSPISSPHLTASLPAASYVNAWVQTDFSFETLSVRSRLGVGEDSIQEMIHYKNGKLNRAVRVMRDPGWQFWEHGEPFPFENTEKYKVLPKHKRVDRALLLEYLSEYGANVASDDFWRTETEALTFPMKPEIVARMTEKPIPCPYCGKPLRTARAKQCQHCFRSWHAAGG
ncbi:hypothetical protein H0E84_15075 [Luteimonas sp. SJ-92]|uniref:Uncharacterized protein n=1 Tax=Luteimonas salinisoli TaxID=2752307 RepID=A0A853JG50_9GAMM|nr:hypothetical protein [Luteimonas salinisoli]NZA27702.1 hypothetical protein [Luteimonas salinisoli]